MCNLQRGKLDTNFLVLFYLTGYILHYMTIHNLCIIWFLCPFLPTFGGETYIYDWQGTLNYCAHFISTFFLV